MIISKYPLLLNVSPVQKMSHTVDEIDEIDKANLAKGIMFSKKMKDEEDRTNQIINIEKKYDHFNPRKGKFR